MVCRFSGHGRKTVLRQLLSSWGELSVDAEQIINADERPTAIQQRDEEFAEAKEVIVVNDETGEINQPANDASSASADLQPATPRKKLV